MRNNIIDKYNLAIDFLKSKINLEPDLAVILGSGIGIHLNNYNLLFSINTFDIMGYPISNVKGHSNIIHLLEYKKKHILVFSGRIHIYEGFGITDSLLPVIISHKIGIKNMILTNSAGAINTNFVPSDIMISESINSMFINKELSQIIEPANIDKLSFIKSFPEFRIYQKVCNASIKAKIKLEKGLYWYMKGPSYETPAEIRMLKEFGADAVGMSSVHESVYANYLGIETVILSCITNYAAGLTEQKPNHKEVLDTAGKSSDKMNKLILETIKLL